MATPTQDRERVLRDTRKWPIAEQIALAHAILQRAEASRKGQPLAAPKVPSAALRGMLANGQPAPTDEEVARWLDEARMEKYGR
jgi:hypothetical protein